METEELESDILQQLCANHDTKEDIVLGPVGSETIQMQEAEMPPENSMLISVKVKIEENDEDESELAEHRTKYECNKASKIRRCKVLLQDIVQKLFCSTCNQYFLSHSKLEKHYTTHKSMRGKPVYQCDVCDKQYINYSNFIKHVQDHGKLKTLRSRNPFSNANTIDNETLRTLTHGAEHLCKLCNKTFKNRAYLKRHNQRHHTDKKSFSCDVCQKTFYCSDNLTSHQRVHRQLIRNKHLSSRLSCELCGKVFTRPWGLKKHARYFHKRENAPTNDKNMFSCDVCERHFNYPYSLIRHKERTHQGEKLICNVCKKEFSGRPNFARHLRIHSEQKRLVCEMCGKGFDRSCALHAHQQSMHL